MHSRFARALVARSITARWLRRAVLLGFALVAWAALSVQAAQAQTVDWTQCLNDNGPGMAKNDNVPDPCSWSNGAVNLINSVYREGDGVPQRLLLGLPTPGTYTLIIDYDFTRANIYAYDFLASPFETQTPALLNECAGVSVQIGTSACTAAFATALPIAFPADPYPEISAQEALASQPRVMLIGSDAPLAGAPVILPATHSFVDPSCLGTNTCGTSTAFTTIQFETTVANQIVGFWFSAHIARGTGGWGSGFGGSSISGAPFHIALVSLNGSSLGNRDNQINAVDILRAGEIEIIKTTIGGDGTFDFTISTEEVFAITTVSNTGSYTLTTLEPGTYAISEVVPSGWRLIDFECSDGSPWDAIELDEEEILTCRFINEQNATLVVDKETDPAGSNTQFDFTLAGPVTATFGLSGVSAPAVLTDLISGTYSLAETIPPGWRFENASCTNGDGIDAITLLAGEVVTCTVNNSQLGSITVVKETVGGDGAFGFDGFSTPTGEPFTVTTTGGTGQIVFNNVPAGVYGFGETSLPPGWIQQGEGSCSNQAFPGEFSLGAGQHITCTFTNRALGRVIVDKVTLPAGSTQIFSFTFDGGPVPVAADVIEFTLADASTPWQSDYLFPGQYSVTETVPAGWILTGATCSDGSQPGTIEVDWGEVVTCTFINTQQAQLTVVKNTIDGNGTFNFVGSLGPFALTTEGTAEGGTAQTTFGELTPGTYAITETVPLLWSLESVACSDGSPANAIALDPGESVTCTFVNQFNAPTSDGEVDEPGAVRHVWLPVISQ
jgi:hypothetical protein